MTLLASGYHIIAGVDEVGRGSLAGPVVAAAVVLPRWLLLQPDQLAEVRDSKQLLPSARTRLDAIIRRLALAVGVGIVSAGEIDQEGIAACTRHAMGQAVRGLPIRPDYVLIDWLPVPELGLPHRGVVDGDALCISIAAASIVAKVARDRLMEEEDQHYQGYGLGQHKGYGTAAHLEALQRLGPCPLHRRTFAPVRQYLMGVFDASGEG